MPLWSDDIVLDSPLDPLDDFRLTATSTWFPIITPHSRIAHRVPDERKIRIGEASADDLSLSSPTANVLGIETLEHSELSVFVRNALHVLADNNLTLLELAPLLTSPTFRAACLNRVQNTEVSSYFRTRFDTRSEAMQGVYRDAILNKISGFTTDQRFRHILGQQRSTFSLLDAMERGRWVLLNLDKGRLGEQASTLGSLLLTKLKNALFARNRRQLFTLYCDEIQNLVAYDAGLDTLLSEARKFGISVVSANQFLEQYPPQMRAAIMAVGTHIFFQLSSGDAEKMSSALDGGKRLAEVLKNLPKRHIVVKSGSHRHQEVLVPNVAEADADATDLYNRCRARWARRRTNIEAEIRQRHRQANRTTEEELNDWE
jgi:hypothetical protein